MRLPGVAHALRGLAGMEEQKVILPVASGRFVLPLSCMSGTVFVCARI